jgi:ATP-dependent 26S proteasome regulatory subunit
MLRKRNFQRYSKVDDDVVLVSSNDAEIKDGYIEHLDKIYKIQLSDELKETDTLYINTDITTHTSLTKYYPTLKQIDNITISFSGKYLNKKKVIKYLKKYLKIDNIIYHNKKIIIDNLEITYLNKEFGIINNKICGSDISIINSHQLITTLNVLKYNDKIYLNVSLTSPYINNNKLKINKNDFLEKMCINYTYLSNRTPIYYKLDDKFTIEYDDHTFEITIVNIINNKKYDKKYIFSSIICNFESIILNENKKINFTKNKEIITEDHIINFSIINSEQKILDINKLILILTKYMHNTILCCDDIVEFYYNGKIEVKLISIELKYEIINDKHTEIIWNTDICDNYRFEYCQDIYVVESELEMEIDEVKINILIESTYLDKKKSIFQNSPMPINKLNINVCDINKYILNISKFGYNNMNKYEQKNIIFCDNKIHNDYSDDVDDDNNYDYKIELTDIVFKPKIDGSKHDMELLPVSFVMKFTDKTIIKYDLDIDDENYILIDEDKDKKKKVNKINVDIITKLKTNIISYGLAGFEEYIDKIIKDVLIAKTELVPEHIKKHIKPSKGIIMYGPPGTGKTTLARNLAKSLEIDDCNIKMITSTEIFNKYLGESEKNVRELFSEAKKDYKLHKENASLHMIIIDEIDAVLTKRGLSENGYKDSVLNQFLGEIDGLHMCDNFIIVGTTNRIDMIDNAVIRPGRFGCLLEIGLPNCDQREKIFEIYINKLAEMDIFTEIDFNKLAEISEGFSGANIEKCIYECLDLYLIDKMNGIDTKFNNSDITRIINLTKTTYGF